MAATAVVAVVVEPDLRITAHKGDSGGLILRICDSECTCSAVVTVVFVSLHKRGTAGVNHSWAQLT